MTNYKELAGRVATLENETGLLRSEIIEASIKWTTQIYDLGTPEYKLTNALTILIEEHPHDECVMARLPELELFFEGSTDIEAINGLKDEILDLFEELEDLSPDELGEDFKTWSRILHKLIQKN